jgi:hypothetical protein
LNANNKRLTAICQITKAKLPAMANALANANLLKVSKSIPCQSEDWRT